MEGTVYWIGVRFDAHDAHEESQEDSYLDRQHTTIINWCCDQRIGEVVPEQHGFPGGEIHAYPVPGLWEVLDLFDSLGSRIGFGIRVERIKLGNQLLDAGRNWLRTIGITMHVGLYEVNTGEVFLARPAGIDTMASLDFC